MLAPDNPPEKLREAVVCWSLMEVVQLKKTNAVDETVQNWARGNSRTGFCPKVTKSAYKHL